MSTKDNDGRVRIPEFPHPSDAPKLSKPFGVIRSRDLDRPSYTEVLDAQAELYAGVSAGVGFDTVTRCARELCRPEEACEGDGNEEYRRALADLTTMLFFGADPVQRDKVAVALGFRL